MEGAAPTEELVLRAGSFFERLGLPVAKATPSEVRRAYHGRAIRCHPDKSAHAQAKEAFQALSEAFEELYDAESQRRYLEAELEREFAALAPQRKGGGDGGQKRAAAGGGGDRGEGGKAKHARKEARKKEKQWYEAHWEDVERELQRREASERRLRAAFVSTQSSRFAEREQEKQVRKLSSICRNLDNAADVSFNRLWGQSRAAAQARESGGNGDANALAAQAARARMEGNVDRCAALLEQAEQLRQRELVDEGLAFVALPFAEQHVELTSYLLERHAWEDPDAEEESGDTGELDY